MCFLTLDSLPCFFSESPNPTLLISNQRLQHLCLRLTCEAGIYWRRAGANNYCTVYFLSLFSPESVSFQTSRKALQLAHNRRTLQVGCHSHPQHGAKQCCLLRTTRCPAAPQGPEESKSLRNLNADTPLNGTKVSSRDMQVVVWFGLVLACSIWGDFIALADLAHLPSETLCFPHCSPLCTS